MSITPLSKVIDVSFKLNETSARYLGTVVTGKQFSTHDTDAWLGFTFSDNNIAAGTYVLTLINLKDKSIFNHEPTAFTTNPFYYKLDAGADEQKNEIRHAGTWLGQLDITLENGDSATKKFMFDIEGHILDGAVVQTILLDDYNALIATINTSKDLLTQYNVDYAALLVDLAAAETTRTATYNQLVADQQANIDAFDVALETGIVAANLAEKLQDFETTNNSRLFSVEQQLEQTNAQVDLLNRGLGETFATLTDLQTAYPTGDTKDHIVGADGHRYFWNDTTWADGGTYQAMEILDGAVSVDKISDTYNLLKKTAIMAATVLSGYDAQTLLPTYYQGGSSGGHFCYTLQIPSTGKLKVMLSEVTMGLAQMILNTSDQRIAHYTLAEVKTTTLSYKTVYSGYYEIDIAKLKSAHPTATKIIFEFLTADLTSAYINVLNLVDLIDYEWVDPAFIDRALSNDAELVLPAKIAIAQGREMNIYYDNIIKNNFGKLPLTGYCVGFPKQYYDSVRIPTSDATTGNNTGYFSTTLTPKLEMKKLITVTKVPLSAGTGLSKKILIIGDSLTDANKTVDELAVLFGTDALTVEFLGTRGNVGAKHEGRSGWSAYDYAFRQTSIQGIQVANPFWNPNTSEFDFSYYMTQQGYTDVDYVTLCLGTNDVSKTSDSNFILSYTTMIADIKAYNPNVKIGISLFPMPSEMTYNQVTKNNFLSNIKLLLSNFDSRENDKLFIMPLYLNVDPMNDFPTQDVRLSSRNQTIVKRLLDYIHPSVAGYNKIADVIYSYIKYMSM